MIFFSGEEGTGDSDVLLLSKTNVTANFSGEILFVCVCVSLSLSLWLHGSVLYCGGQRWFRASLYISSLCCQWRNIYEPFDYKNRRSDFFTSLKITFLSIFPTSGQNGNEFFSLLTFFFSYVCLIVRIGKQSWASFENDPP